MPFVLFQTVISVFIFFKVSVTYQHSTKNSGQNHIVFLFVCLFVSMFVSSKSEKCYPMR